MLKWNYRSFVSGHDRKRDTGRESSSRWPSPSRLTEFILLLALVAVLTTPAYSRDDSSETYPNEITVSELERYGRWLNLSESQFVAARAMHQAYLETFATLKAEVIDPHGWPREEVETTAEYLDLIDAYWDETEVIRNKIRRVDGALLDEIMDILDDSQFARMQRVRDCRAIQTLRVAPMIGSTQRFSHDVTKFAYDLELSEADAALLDPILQAYERRLLILSKPLHEKAFKMETENYREYIRRGFGDDKWINSWEDSPDEWVAARRNVWLDKGRQIMALIFDIDELNETTTRRIEQTLSHEAVQAWLDEYMTREFYNRANRPRLKRRLLMKVIDQARPLPERDETIFREQLLTFDLHLRRIERRLLELDLKYFPKVLYITREDVFSTAKAQTNEDKDNLDEAGKDLETLVNRFLLQLEQTLSPDGIAKWDAAYAVATERKSTRPTHSDGRGIHGVTWASIFFESRDLRRIARIFELNEKQQALLQEAYLAYGKRRTAIETDFPKEKPIKPGWEPTLSGKLRDRLRQSDEILLSALVSQLEDATDRRKVDWLRNARRRNRLGYRISPWGAAGGLDLVLFILDSDLATEEIDTLSPLIEEYDAKAVRIYERQFTIYTTLYEWMLENQDSNSGISPYLYAWRQAQSEVAKLNADTMFAIGERLGSVEAAAMIELFKRYCYGPVFKDPDRADPILNRAGRIEDLAASQRESLLDLKVMFLEEYERLTDAMLDDAKYTLRWHLESMTDSSSRQTPTVNYEAYKRNRFLRDELNAATIVKLRTILTTEQLDAIGGLPKVK